VNVQQARVNVQQARVNVQQARVNVQQARVNVQQCSHKFEISIASVRPGADPASKFRGGRGGRFQ